MDQPVVIGVRPLRLSAYILASDTSRLIESLTSYYSIVEKIIVSCDENSRGWTGIAIRTSDVIDLVRKVDVDNKCIVIKGDYSLPENFTNPIESDTYQRTEALIVASKYGDWVLQIDADEVVMDTAGLYAWIQYADSFGYDALEWPLLVLYRQVGTSTYLAVCGTERQFIYEYPGAIAVRKHTPLKLARRAVGRVLRMVVAHDHSSMSLLLPCSEDETRMHELSHNQAVVHHSWSRTPAELWEKVQSWGHSRQMNPFVYFWTTWLPSPLTYKYLRNFHPMDRRLWPRLRKIDLQ